MVQGVLYYQTSTFQNLETWEYHNFPCTPDDVDVSKNNNSFILLTLCD